MSQEESDKELAKAENATEDLKEVQTRLAKIVKHAGTRAYEGTDMVADAEEIEKDEKRQHEVSSDPFNDYGYGIIAYFSLQRLLMYAYVLIAAMALGLMASYGSGGAFEDTKLQLMGVAQYSLGNLGPARTACITQNIDISADQRLSCDTGLVITNYQFSGTVPAEQGKRYQTMKTENAEPEDFGNDFCGDPSKYISPDDACTNLLLDAGVEQHVHDKCLGEKECTIDLTSFKNPSPGTSVTDRAACTSKYAYFYLQYEC